MNQGKLKVVKQEMARVTVRKQLISGNNCTDKDIVSLLYDYTIKGTTDRVNDFICKEGKLRVAKDVQEACNNAHGTTEACKYMEEWYLYEGNSWKKAVCGNQAYDPTDHFCDSREDGSNTVYRMVTIGEGENEQTWMAENLNYETENSWCGGGINNTSEGGDCDVYGRHYTWNAAMSACPTGWHLPDTVELRILASNVDPKFIKWGNGDESNTNMAGKSLKASSGWNAYEGIENEDTYLFSALPAGMRNLSFRFEKVGTGAYFWSSVKESDSDHPFFMRLYYNNGSVNLISNYVGDANGRSVRCIKD